MSADKDECDLLIIMGSSLKVRPVALIPSSIPVEVPQILINREPLGHLTFDIELLGDCDVIIQHLCEKYVNLTCQTIKCDLFSIECNLFPIECNLFSIDLIIGWVANGKK